MAGERDKLEEKFMQALGAYKVQPSEKVWTQIQKKTRGNKLNRDGV
ncbi:MAG: hypothetical protein RIS47_885, partial [Bacteroidota bacterium]